LFNQFDILEDPDFNVTLELRSMSFDVRAFGGFCGGCSDEDGDGFGKIGGQACTFPGADCNDGDVNINPGAGEICDNIDNNCDGEIDEGFDQDDDGFKTCENDCDDSNPLINPAATETCDGIDNSCNGNVDFAAILGDLDNSCGADSCQGTDTFFDNFCNEGVGCAANSLTQDNDGDGFNGLCTDCNDNSDITHPGAPEFCPDDGIDNNCDGETVFDCNAFCDADNDGFFDDSKFFCLFGRDCDDTNAAINPDADEICNGVDNNCDDDSGFWIAAGQTTSNRDSDPTTGVDNRDTDNDLVNDCSVDICLNTPAGAAVNAEGCVAKQLKQKASNQYADLEADLLQPGSEIGQGEYQDVLDQYLLPAKLGIINNNYLFKFDVKVTINGSEVEVKKGSTTYDHQNNAVEKLEEFKGKKINNVEIRNIPSINNELNEIEIKLVEDSRILADILLTELDCGSLSGSAATECNLGLSFFTEAPTKSTRAEQIDVYKKAWEQGVKVLEIQGIQGSIACTSCN